MTSGSAARPEPRPRPLPVVARPLPPRPVSTLLVRADDLPTGPCRVSLGGAAAAWAVVVEDAAPGCRRVTVAGVVAPSPGAPVALEREVSVGHPVAAGARVELVEVGQVLGPTDPEPGVVVPGGPAAYGPYTDPDPAAVAPRPVRWSGVGVLGDDRTLVVTGSCGDDEEVASVSVQAADPVVVTVEVGTVPAVAEAQADARWRNHRPPRSLTTHTWAVRVALPEPLAGRRVLDGA